MRVVVLMSTYQGERWVVEQVHSILDQLPSDGQLTVRDDGSRDGTVERVEAFGDPRVVLRRGENIGFVRSFQTLLASVPEDAEMIMLSDQDDIWLPGKIERAWRIVGTSGPTPTLYCSRLKLVDGQLDPLGLSPDWPRPPCFKNALTENIVTGCTVALNPAALRLVKQCGDATRIYFHDWWFYLVVAAFGRVVFDPEPTVLYRQHGHNAIGMGVGLMRYLTILRFVRRQSWTHIMFNQIENFRTVYGALLPASQRRLMDDLFDPHSIRSFLRLLLAPTRMRQTILGDLLFRGMLIADVVAGRGLLPKSRQAEDHPLG
jgi:glycosyltransferase involved in cell wall biosynthesis